MSILYFGLGRTLCRHAIIFFGCLVPDISLVCHVLRYVDFCHVL